MLKRLCHGLAVVSLAAGMCLPAFAADRSEMRGTSQYAMPNTNIDWSRRYELTPIEVKRFRAMGLRDKEIGVIANAARISGREPDMFAQMIFRGATSDMIAQHCNIPVSLLEEERPEWKTPEWEQAVREGRWSMPGPSMRTAPSREERRDGTRRY